jgi:glycosyltransferase involved in cell wall biosynthesis
VVSKLRILILSQYYWPETFRITEVVQALRDDGCEVLVLTGQPNYPKGVSFGGYSWWSISREEHEGVTILRVPLIPRGSGCAICMAFNYLSFVLSATLFGSWLVRGFSIDLILVFAPSPIFQAIPAIWLAKLKKASLVTWVQDLWPESLMDTGYVHNPRILAMVSGVVRWIYRKNNLLLVPSQAFIDPVKDMSRGVPVLYHPNPGDFAFSEPLKNQDCPIKFGSGFNVVFTGNLGTVQSLKTILDSAEILLAESEIKIYLIGSGSQVDWVRSEISSRNLTNVELPGHFDLIDMPSIMSQASALLVSLTRSHIMSKTVPSKVQAYLASGKPIIASLDGEGARIISEAGAGLISNAEDAKGLAWSIISLRNMSVKEREVMGHNARDYYAANYEPRFLSHKLKGLLYSSHEDFQ